jgi:HEAT repeat protein
MKILRYLLRRRATVAWILSIAIIIAALLSPEGRLWVKGLWRREPFYRGFPACYWTEQIKQGRPSLAGPVYEFVGRVAHLSVPFWGTDSASVPVLLHLLKHEDLRCRQFAVKTLPRMANSAQIIQPLIEAAVDTESGVSKEAAAALGMLGKPKDVEVIVKGLLKCGDDQSSMFEAFLRSHAEARLSWGDDLESDPVADALDDTFQHGEPDVSRRARMVFDMLGPKAATFARLTNVLRRPDGEAREKAKRDFFATSPDRSATPGFIILLRDKDIATKRKAADAIIPVLWRWNGYDRNGTYRVVFQRAILPALMELARTDDIECRRKASEAFLRLYHQAQAVRVVPVLVELLRSNDRITQDNALWVLRGLASEAEPAVPALLDLMKREPLKIKVKDQNTPDIGGGVPSPLGQQNQARIGPREVLVSIGSPAVPELIEALRQPERQVRLGAAETLRLIEPPAKNAIPALIAALYDDDPMVRTKIVLSLGNITLRTNYDEKAIGAVSKMLGDGNHEVRESAAFALGSQLFCCYPDNLASHSAVLALIGATKSKDAHLRIAAARGLQTMCANASCFLSATQKDFNAKNWSAQPVQMVVLTLIEIFQWDNSQWQSMIPSIDFLDVSQRRSAITLLGKIGPEAKSAIPALTEALRDVELYEVANEALAKIKAKKTSPSKEH